MTTLGSTLETGGEIVGTRAGQILGGAIGELFGPEAVPLGVWLGGKAGAYVGQAAGAYLAHRIEQANADAEKKLKDQAADKPCLNCGEIDCFKSKGDPAEFARQLKEQEDAINGMDPDKLLKNMDKFDQIGRGADDAKNRQDARDNWIANRKGELFDQYSQNMGGAEAEAQAAKDAAKEASVLDATHDLDLGAGGTGNISGLGGKSANRSLGPQWAQGRAEQLKKHAKEAKKQGKKMNVKLKICPPEGGGEQAPDSAPNSGPAAPAAGADATS